MAETQTAARRRRLILLLLAAVILVPSLFGFGTKFIEFIALYRGDVEGAFAITPILNYLLASLGFLCLFGWAIFTGMFRDIEGPKYTMLENEALLDDAAQQPASSLPTDLTPSVRREAGDHHRFRDFYERD